MTRLLPTTANTALGAALALSFLFEVPAFFTPHRDLDERIFLGLAENLRVTGRYTLQGLPILSELSPHVYDRPLFHHPPLFGVLLVPFARTPLQPFAPLVPWLGSACTLVAAWLFLRRFTEGRGFWTVGFPLVALALDPLLHFTATKLWLDALFGGLAALSMTLFVSGLRHARRGRYWLGAGVVWGFALLAKAPALFCLALFLPLGLVETRREANSRALVDLALRVIFPAALLVVPWLAVFHARYGIFLPDWTRPDAWMTAHSPFVRAAIDRPAYYYAAKWILVNPLVLVIVVAAVLRLRATRAPEILGWAWFLGAIAIFTALGLWGQGYQMRFVTVAVAPLYLVFGTQHDGAAPPRPIALLASVALLANAATDAILLAHPDLAEVVGLVEVSVRAIR